MTTHTTEADMVQVMALDKHPYRFWALLDRDGTIIVDKKYLSDPGAIEFTPGAVAALQLLRDAGFGLIVVTNQSGIGRGYFDEKALSAVHNRLLELLAAEGLQLVAIEYCPHSPHEGCSCRKPSPGMLFAAMGKFGISADRAVLIGDSEADVGAAAAAGIRSLRVNTNGAIGSELSFLEAARRAIALMP